MPNISSLDDYLQTVKTELFDELFDGVYIVDTTRKIRFWNKGAERISGYLRDRMLMSACPDAPLQHEDQAFCRLCEKDCPAKKVMDTGSTEACVLYLRHADGRLLPVETNVRPLYDDNRKVVGAIEVFRDVSQWKQIESLSLEKDRLMGVLAHDIRNPLAVIKTVAIMLDHEHEPKLRDLGGMLKRRSEFALHLVNSLLDAQAIESGHISLELQTFQPEEVLRSAITSFAAAAQAKAIQLDLVVTSSALTLKSDPNRFEEILNNLISNAIHYSQRNSKVTVTLGEYPEGMEFSVADQGVGIAAEDLGKLFKPFGKTRNRTTGGEDSHGLGLYIVKRIVDCLKGTIRVESQVGKSTIFTVRIPYSENPNE